uniref:HECT domain-containing protein n=1 Tax=Cyprinus carpio TaxID=7962 RepID=A0A8C2AN58_CYPCA
MTELIEDILSCGYNGPVNVEKREEILCAVVLHAILQLLPLLSQLREGLKLYGLDNVRTMLSIDIFRMFLENVILPFKHEKFLGGMNHLQDFLQEVEVGDTVDYPGHLSPSTFLQWLTGQGHIPVLPEEKRNFRVFYGSHTVCYPTVTACSNTIHLPVKHMQTSTEFKQVMTEAFHLGQAFHQV